VSQYLQSSTANPYGHRPWATRLYTGFENYSFLKQPQNTILREDPAMRPELYKPPELKSGLGDVTIVGGSGKILRRARRRKTLGALPMMYDGARSQMIVRGPFTNGGAVSLQPTTLPPPIIWNPPAPLTILPPSMVPPPPQLVSSGPDGTIYALPGNATTPGSPFMAPAPGELPTPAGSVPVTTAPAAATAPTRSFSDWFNATDYVASVPNGYLALGGVAVLYFFSRKKR
jgi:hypothetical protein